MILYHYKIIKVFVPNCVPFPPKLNPKRTKPAQCSSTPESCDMMAQPLYTFLYI